MLTPLPCLPPVPILMKAPSLNVAASESSGDNGYIKEVNDIGIENDQDSKDSQEGWMPVKTRHWKAKRGLQQTGEGMREEGTFFQLWKSRRR